MPQKRFRVQHLGPKPLLLGHVNPQRTRIVSLLGTLKATLIMVGLVWALGHQELCALKQPTHPKALQILKVISEQQRLKPLKSSDSCTITNCKQPEAQKSLFHSTLNPTTPKPSALNPKPQTVYPKKCSPKGPSSPYLWFLVPIKAPKSLNNEYMDP